MRIAVRSVKHGGLGKELGSEALDYYMETKSVVVGRDVKNPG